MKCTFRHLWVLTALGSVCFAQSTTVKRNVNLRSDHSTESAIIEKLRPPAAVELLDANPADGFYHVRTGDGVEGWAWSRNLATTSTPLAPLHGQTNSSEVSSSWDKPVLSSSMLHTSEGDCGDTGDGGDTATNLRKNRVDIPTEYHSVSWKAVNDLSFPQGAPRSRLQWTKEQLAVIAPIEGVPLSVEGFLTKVKVEKTSPSAQRGGESTNCHFRMAPDVDWHMPLTANAGEGEDRAIVVETTPRIRQQHPKWTTARLAPWTGTGQKVRISGWLMLDPEHQDMINHGQRSTLWEIHPVTKIEVFKDGQWVDLDQL